jgi:hypothetical protein
MLQENGVPMPVEQVLISPPRCRIGALTPEERAAARARSPIAGKYDTRVNRESAYEILNKRQPAPAQPEAAPETQPKQESALGELLWGTKHRQGMVETMAKQAARTVGSEVGRKILRGVLGGILGDSKRS